jgi:hypothetical protein
MTTSSKEQKLIQEWKTLDQKSEKEVLSRKEYKRMINIQKMFGDMWKVPMWMLSDTAIYYLNNH